MLFIISRVACYSTRREMQFFSKHKFFFTLHITACIRRPSPSIAPCRFGREVKASRSPIQRGGSLMDYPITVCQLSNKCFPVRPFLQSCWLAMQAAIWQEGNKPSPSRNGDFYLNNFVVLFEIQLSGMWHVNVASVNFTPGRRVKCGIAVTAHSENVAALRKYLKNPMLFKMSLKIALKFLSFQQ